MRTKNWIRTAVLGAVTLGAVSAAWAAIPGTIATFDADAQSFTGSTIATVQIHVLSGGNLDGHLQIRKDLEPGFDIGTQNSTLPEWLGDYAASGVNGAGFDLNVFNTTLDDAQLRFRRNVAENGWNFSFGNVTPNANAWESYDVAFDPTWSDGLALANGWSQEAGAPSFADLMGSVGWVEVKVFNEGSAIVGVDNVRIVPEPGALGLLLLAGAFLRRR